MKKSIRQIFSFSLLLLSTSFARADWPMFQADQNHSAYKPADPLRLPLQPLWSFNTQSTVFGFDSAVISNKKAYFGSITGNVVATDLVTGSVLWNFTAQGSVYISPVIDNNKLFFGSADGNIYALDAMSGQLLWQFNVGNNINSSPVISGGTLFVGANSGDVLALDTSSGTLLWRNNLGDYILSSPALDDNNLYVGLMNNTVVALNKLTGVKIWETKTGDSVRASPSVANGRVYIGSSDGVFRALSATDGSVLWSYQTAGPIVSGAAVSSGTVYFASLDKYIYAVDSMSGTLLWKYGTGDKIYSSPALINNSVFIGSNDKNLYILDPYSGNLKTSMTLGGRIVSASAESFGRVVVVTDDGMVNAFKSPNNPPTVASNLAVNGAVDPYINTAITTFSWTFHDPDSGDMQTAFQLQVSSNASGFTTNVIATDTGKVISPNNNFVLNTLLNEGTYFWRIQTYDLFDDSGPFTDGTSHFLIDRTPPNISIQSPLAGSKFIASRNKIVINYTATDNFDPVPSSSAFLASNTSSFTITVTSGQVIEPLSLPAGLWALTVSATDFAGNFSSVTTGTFEVIHDTLPPRTSLSIGDPKFISASSSTFITSRTSLVLSATDDLLVTGDGVGLGVSSIQLNIDQAGYQTIAISSTGTNPMIAPAFNIASDGVHALSYFSQDIVPNIESIHTAILNVDNTPPVTQLAISGDQLSTGNLLYASTRTQFTFTSQDPMVNGAASGVKGLTVLVDGSTMALTLTFSSQSLVSSPFSLSGGTHSISYFALDNVGNQEILRSTYIIIDSLPPRTRVNLSGSQFSLNGSTFVTSKSNLSLSAMDDLSLIGDGIGIGVRGTDFSVDSSSFSLYSTSFTMANDGVHTVSFFSKDRVNNVESAQTATFQVDNTPPVTQVTVLGDQFFTGNLTYVSPRTNFVFTSQDPMVNGVASGVRNQTILVDGSTVSLGVVISSLSAVSSPLLLSGGTHTISFFATDNLGNQELVKSTSVIVDTQPPRTKFNLSGAEFILNGSTYITSQTGLTLSAMDDLLNPGDGTGVGVKETRYGIDSFSFSLYSSSFNIPGDGNHDLNFYSKDEVNNVESTQTAVFLVDNTPPVSQLSIFQGPSYISNGQPPMTYVSTLTFLALNAQDPVINGVASGVRSTQFGVTGVSTVPAALSPYLNPFTLNEGTRTIIFDSTDNLGNAESTKTAVILADGTPPRTSISVSGAEFDTGTVNTVGSAPLQQFVPLLPSATTLTYINGDSRIQLSAQDPVVNGVASGARNTYYAIRTFNYDGSGNLVNSSTSPYQIYLATSFPLTEGVRDVLYYSEDNVLNTESVNVKQYRVDATSPSVRLSFMGGTQFRPDGQNPSCCSDTLTYVSGNTAYRFDVQDATSNNVMSGAKEMEIAFDSGAVLGGPANIGADGVVSTSFTVVPGTYAIFTPCPACISSSPYSEGEHLFRFHGQDYAGNVSVDSVTYINVDRTPPVTQFIITGTQFVSNGTVYVNTTTAFGFIAQDPIVNKVASGVKRTLYSIDGGQFQTFTANFTLPEGIHTIQFYSQDNVVNTEKTQTVTLYVDGSPPVTSISISAPQFTAFGTLYISQKTPIALSAIDPIVKGVSSGVNKTLFTVDALPLMNYTSSFTIQSLLAITSGTHRITYYSQDNVGNSENPKFQDVFVSIIPDFAMVGVNSINLNGKSQATGDVRSNGLVSLNGQAQVTGNVFGSTVTLVGKSTVTANVVGNAPQIIPVPIDLGPIASSVTITNNDSQIPKTQKGQTALGSDLHLTVQAQDSLILSSGTYFFTGIDVLGGSSVTVTGNAQVYCSGSVNVSGGSKFNAGGNVTGLTLFVNAATGAVSVGGGSELDGTFYAPYSTVSVNGVSRVIGNVFGFSGALDGQSIVAVSSQGITVSTATTGSSKKVAALTYAQGPSPDFVLGEVYSFPNPAVGGKKPTLHIECGIADSVEIRIYDITGDLLHEVRLDQLPQAGFWTPQSGLKYAYEYTWDTSGVASGIYIYVINAKKTGKQDIRVMKKIGLVK